MTPRRPARPWGGFARVFEPWAFVSPAIVLIAGVMLVPLVIGVSYSFRAVSLLNPAASGWIGWDNYVQLWGDRHFWRALWNTLVWTLGSLSLQFGLGLGLALLLNTEFRGKRVFQALVFLPWAVPTFLTALTFAWLFNPTIGPFAYWLAAARIIDEPFNILGDRSLAMWGPITANVWFGVPFFAITLLAALSAIPGDLYEAAELDGVAPWERFRRITLPFLAPTIAITVMLRTIWIANFADLIWIMTGGGPANATQTLSTYIFSTAYRKLDFGYASTIAVVLLVLLLAWAAVVMWVRARLPETR